MRARPNHGRGSQHKRPLHWSVRKGSVETEVARYDFEFIDDEYVSYIGQRRAHPYGEASLWPTTPTCTGTVDCALR